MKVQQLWKSLGPITLSALSFFISFLILQPITLLLGPNFNLCASRGPGKIALLILAILHILLLLRLQSKNFLKKWFATNLLFFKDARWLKTFLSYFSLGFLLHVLLLSVFFASGCIFYNADLPTLKFSLVLRILFGFVATFFLAWTEELIFRGTMYPYFTQYFSTLTSLLVTSFVFSISHAIAAPLSLPLGIGLFLLGFFLNLTFVITGKLYAGMGIHAGLVFVKVLLRRVPLLAYLPPASWPWWFAKDLRVSPVTHILFLTGICVLFLIYHKRLNK